MLNIYRKLDGLRFGELMLVYGESNRQNALDKYPRMDKNVGLITVEQDFYSYLHNVFFKTEGAFYAILEEDGIYICALRMEPYRDGLLLAALETRPQYRGKGYARKLILSVLSQVSGKVYSHVDKQNSPSLAVHYACGFEKIGDGAVYLDGSSAPWCITFCREGKIT